MLHIKSNFWKKIKIWKQCIPVTIFLFIFQQANCQENKVMDFESPHIISDWLYFEGYHYIYSIYDNCGLGLLEKIDDSGSIDTVYHFGNYYFLSKFDYSKDYWTCIIQGMPGDDFGGRYLIFLYLNESGELVEINDYDNKDLQFSMVDYALSNDTILYILEQFQNVIKVMDLNGNLIDTIELEVQYKWIDSRENRLYTFDDYSIILLDSNYKTEYIYNSTSIIRDYIWQDSILFILRDHDVVLLNNQLEELELRNLATNRLYDDINVEGDTIILLSSENHISGIDYFDSNGMLIKGFNESFVLQQFESFVKGDKNEIVWGYQHGDPDRPYPVYNGIHSSIEDIGTDKPDFGIDSLFLVDVVDRDHYFTFYYTYNLFNNSQDTLNQCFIASNSIEVFNCANNQYLRRFENLNLSPGHKITINDSADLSIYGITNMCIYLISANGNFDTQFENNIACRIEVGLDDIMTGSSIVAYPNPATNILKLNTVDSDYDIQIINIQGKKMNSWYRSDNELDISQLEKGVYYLVITSGDKLKETICFVKQ